MEFQLNRNEKRERKKIRVDIQIQWLTLRTSNTTPDRQIWIERHVLYQSTSSSHYMELRHTHTIHVHYRNSLNEKKK